MDNNPTRIIAISIFLIVIVAICWYFSTIMIYLFFALLLTLACRPLVNLLCKIRIGKKQFPRPVAAIISMTTLFSIIWAIFAILNPLISKEIKAISSIDPQLVIDGYQQFLKQFAAFAHGHGIDITVREISEALANEVHDFLIKLDFGHIFSNMVNIIASIFVAVFAILFLTFFSLSENGIILKTAKKFFPAKLRNNFDNIVFNTRKQVVRYFCGVLLEMSIVGFTNGFVCFLLGVPNAVLIGVISGMLNIIPYIGPLIAVVLSVIISCTSMLPLSPSETDIIYNVLKIACTFLGVKMLDDFVLQPFIYGKSVQAHPIEIFIVILAAAQIGGILGMVFAVPVYSILRIVVKEFFGQYFENQEASEPSSAIEENTTTNK